MPMTTQGEDAMKRFERLLDETLKTATFTVQGANDTFGTNDIRTIYARGTPQEYFDSFSHLTPIVRDTLKASLVEEIELLLCDYVNPDTRCVGHGLVKVLGGRINPPLELFVDDVVCAAAALGVSRVSQLLSDWSNGKPAHYEMRTVLFGANIDRPIELPREGIRINVMPDSFDDLPYEFPSALRYIEGSLSPDSVLGRPVLSVACSGSPVFHMPVTGMGGRFYEEWAYGELPKFSLDAFCEVLSLAGNGCIQAKYIWPHAPDLKLFVAPPEGMGLPGGFVDTGSRITLTQRHLEDARDLFLMQDRLPEKTRTSLKVAIHRWIMSKKEISQEDKLIELRIALEALYLRGEGSEMSYRMATRGAWHLGDSLEERKVIFSTLKVAYSLASTIVHARKTKATGFEQSRTLEDGQDMCRKGILKVLRNGEPNWDELVFGRE